MRLMGMMAAACLAGSALASFDLALVLDSGQNVVHRYDADSGVYLGNFGGGTLSNVRGITVDKTSNTAYVTHQNGYSAWDYNTGFFKFYNDRPSSGWDDLFLTSDGRILLTRGGTSSTSAIRRMSNLTNTATVSTFFTSTVATYSTAVEGPNGNYFLFSPSSGEVTRFDQNTFATISVTSVPNIGTTSKGAGNGTEFVTLLPNGRVVRNTLGQASSSLGLSLSTPFTSAVEFEFGHFGQGWGLGVNASGTRLQRYARTAGGQGGFYDPLGPGRTLSQVGTPVGLAIVTAPEPGTMIALGFGAAAMLRRRRGR